MRLGGSENKQTLSERKKITRQTLLLWKCDQQRKISSEWKLEFPLFSNAAFFLSDRPRVW